MYPKEMVQIRQNYINI